MRIIFLNTDYPSFLRSLYRRQRLLAFRAYDRQMSARNASLFGTADFMSRHFRDLGHDAVDIHANNRPLQEAWMEESAIRCWINRFKALCILAPGKFGGYRVPLHSSDARFWEILRAQIRAFAPDVTYNHDPSGIPAGMLKSLLPSDCALVAQIASPRNPDTEWHLYDLVISSLPNFVEAFRKEGIRAEYLPLSFEGNILNVLTPPQRDIPLSFVGSITRAHRERAVFLETIARETDIAIWGDGVDTLPSDSALVGRYREMAWGRDMFMLLARSQITINKHIDVSENYANNMRLFEATGMGACLVTDWKENLGELFEPGREVVAYRSTEECLALIRHYRTRSEECAQIARAGQTRCLRDHTYSKRMAQLAQILVHQFG